MIDKVCEKLIENHHQADLALVKKAYLFAYGNHRGQKRLSGDPYISHPLEVAKIVAELGLDEVTVAAALLHDVVEDSNVSIKEIEEQFGERVAILVKGVTILGEIDFSILPEGEVQEAKFRAEIESLRKFFLAMAEDIRVVIIKLADRLHNMRTLEPLSGPDRLRISRETLEIFAPLADRLGMGNIKAELEDIAFRYSDPENYREIKKYMAKNERERKNYLARIKKIIIDDLEKEGIKATIDGRVKHLYSVYKKLNKVNQDINKIYDLLAVRVIVNNVEDCYKTMGIIHRRFKPLIYLIKDYIAVPKPNGYQSLHTTVFGVKGKITEIQIRTRKMHEEAENGVAAHWHYDEHKVKTAYRGKALEKKTDHLGWIQKIATWQKKMKSGGDFAENLKIDLFSDRIFVFSPKGNIFDLPEGATPVDFAYTVHTTIGHRCRGAKVNKKMVQLDYQLSNRDVVEIIPAAKNDKGGPSLGWLEFVKTSQAKQKIRNWYRSQNRDQNIETGQRLLNEELVPLGLSINSIDERKKRQIIDISGWSKWEDLIAAIGDGTINAKQVVKRILDQKYLKSKSKLKKLIKGSDKDRPISQTNLDGIVIRYAECCKPKKGDKVKGFITQGQGITIHRANCPSLLTSPKEKIIDVDFEKIRRFPIKLEINGNNRVGLVRDVTAALAKEKLIIDDIKAFNIGSKTSLIKLGFILTDLESLPDIIGGIKKIEGVDKIIKKL